MSRIARLFRYIEAAKSVLLKPLVAPRPPIHAQIEVTTFCNLNCKPCLRSKYLLDAPQHLSPENFQRIVAPMRPLKISLSGSGEPLMNPDFFEIIRRAKAFGASVNSTSNGTLLTPERAAELVKSGLDLLKISIDAATPDTYRNIRGEDCFLRVVDGVRALIEAKKRLGSPTPYIRFNYVVSRDNYRELAETAQLADRLGVDAMYFQPLLLFGIEERQAELVGDMTQDGLTQEIRRALQLGRSCRVETNLRMFLRLLPQYWNKYEMEKNRQRRLCMLPWFSAYVTLRGDMRPCCTCLYDSTTMGNLLESPLDDVWNSRKYQAFRRAIRAGKRPFPVCESCVPQTVEDVTRYSKILPGFLR